MAATILTGEDKKNNAEKQKWLSLEEMLAMMVQLSIYYKEAGEEELAARERNRAEELITLFKDDCDFTDVLREELRLSF